MKRYADLHLHTIYSDGTYTPEELIKVATRAGLSCISVVDHDTVEGIIPTRNAAEAAGIELIAGIELSCEYNSSEVHILGYLIESEDILLQKKLAQIRLVRRQRIYQMVEKLKGMQVNIEPEEVFKLSRTDSVGRLHLARAIVKNGYSASIPEAFQRFIGDHAPAYVCGFHLNPQEAINLILSAKGIPVLAHPYTLAEEEIIFKFVDYGLKGLEVYYPEHSRQQTDRYRQIALKYNLLATGGSDCHGQAKPEVAIGSVKIPYQLVEKLKEEKEKLR